MIRCFNGMSSDRNVFSAGYMTKLYKVQYRWLCCTTNKKRLKSAASKTLLSRFRQRMSLLLSCKLGSLATASCSPTHPLLPTASETQTWLFVCYPTSQKSGCSSFNDILTWNPSNQLGNMDEKMTWKTLSSSFSLNPFKLVSTLLYLYMIHLYGIHVK